MAFYSNNIIYLLFYQILYHTDKVLVADTVVQQMMALVERNAKIFLKYILYL